MTLEEFANGKVGRFGPCINHEDGSTSCDPIRVPFQFRVLTGGDTESIAAVVRPEYPGKLD